MHFLSSKGEFTVWAVVGSLSAVLLVSSVWAQQSGPRQAINTKSEVTESISVAGLDEKGGEDVTSAARTEKDIFGNENSQVDLDDGLFARYPFEGNANDASGNGNDGAVNGATLTTGHEGSPESAYKFDGSTYIEVPPWNRGKSSSRSWTGWVLAQDGGGYFQRSNYNAGNGGEWQLEWLDDSDKIRVRTVIQPGNNKLKFKTDKSYDKEAWHFVAAIWDLENNEVEVYVNGEFDGSITIPDGHIGLGDGGQSTDWKLGGTWDGGDFHGKIDNVRIYDRALSESEVQELYGNEGGSNQIIAFSSTRDGNEEIYKMNGDGSNQVRLTSNSDPDRGPAISPNGQDIVFFSKRTGSWEIFKISVDGTGLTQLTSGLPADQGARNIDWSPDGNELAFDIKNNDVFKIYRADPDGSNVEQLIDEDASGETLDYTKPHYSPDGNYITMRGNVPFNGFTSEVWIADADGSNVTQLTSSPGDARADQPAFAVNSGTLKVVHARTPDSEIRQIWTMNTDGSAATNISDNNYDDSRPMGPSGAGAEELSDQILFQSDRSGEIALWRMKIDGSNPQMITSKDISGGIDWWVSSAIPVEMARFDARVNGENAAVLTWQTASETNNAGFNVQHQSPGGKSWSSIGFVGSKASGGSTSEPLTYRYTAENLAVGTHRFRLKQVDLDGSTTLTDPVTITLQMQDALRLTTPSPNPVSETATFSFAVKKEAETSVTVYNVLGQKVRTLYRGTPTVGESQTVRLRTSGLPSGTYFLRLSVNGKVKTRQLTVVR